MATMHIVCAVALCSCIPNALFSTDWEQQKGVCLLRNVQSRIGMQMMIAGQVNERTCC